MRERKNFDITITRSDGYYEASAKCSKKLVRSGVWREVGTTPGDAASLLIAAIYASTRALLSNGGNRRRKRCAVEWQVMDYDDEKRTVRCALRSGHGGDHSANGGRFILVTGDDDEAELNR